jgi:DNA-binding transcriptional MerR regulator
MAAEDRDKRTYKIGEVCRMADVQPYVLRYWETEFPALAPTKSGGGQRLYSQREIDIVMRIKQLLYSEGFTIAGAKKKLETELDDDLQLTVAVDDPPLERPVLAEPSEELQDLLEETKRELRRIVAMLKP